MNGREPQRGKNGLLIYCIKNREGIARHSVQNHFHSADIGFRQIMIALAMEKSKWYNLNLANVFFKSGMIEAWGVDLTISGKPAGNIRPCAI